MKKNVLKGLILSLLMTTVCISMVGCGKKEEVEEITYSLTPLNETELQENKYYVKNANSFYELPLGTYSMQDERDMIAKEPSPDRIIWFGADDVCIPTLYKDDVLVYTTTELPDSFTWERYYDDGYTIGLYGLEVTPSGSYSAVLSLDSIYWQSSFGALFGEQSQNIEGMDYGDSIVIDSIDSTKLDYSNVSESGVITGLTYNKPYNVDVYYGSTYIPLAGVVADVHAFHSFELYSSSLCNYMQANYIQIVIPDSLVSGYYFINGAGFVRYVDNYRSEGTAAENFNAPYYLYDEDGNQYTADEYTVPESVETDVIDGDDYYSSIINIDCSNQSMTIDFTYSEAVEKNIDGSKNVLSDLEAGLPELFLIDPDGNNFVFSNSNQKQSTLTCSVENPVPGPWEVRIFNAKNRLFSIDTEFISGHNDSIVHEGSGTGVITAYNSYTLNDGIIKITWSDTTSMPSNIVIETPDGKKITRDSIELLNYEEGRGYATFYIGNIPYGEYKISISGTSLGRIRSIICERGEENIEAKDTLTDETDIYTSEIPLTTDDEYDSFDAIREDTVDVETTDTTDSNELKNDSDVINKDSTSTESESTKPTTK